MPRSSRNPLSHPAIRRQVLFRCSLWTLVVALILFLGIHFSNREIRRVALAQAREIFKKDVTFRLWVTQRGGVYVPLDEKTPANPYLQNIPDREITTTKGKVYTLVNPAYMTRMLHELGRKEFGLQGHITSLNPIRPENVAEPWEQHALRLFQSGPREYWEEAKVDGHPQFRYMGALITVEGCLRCHGDYQVGDVRGGISVTVPLGQGVGTIDGLHNLTTILGLGLLWVIGLGAILAAGWTNQKRIEDRQRSEAVLRDNEKKYRTLFSESPDAYLIIADGIFIDCNRATEKMLRGERTQIVGQSPEILSPEYQPDGRKSSDAARDMINTALRSGTHTFEWVHRRLDGSDFFVEVSIALMGLDGAPALFTTWRDLTERKEAEQERLRLQAQLQQTQKLESLGSLAGGVAHDMNNVLGAILGLASAHIGDQPYGSPLHRALDTICKATERGGKMVKGLLSFARQSPARELELDLNELLQEEVSLLERTTLARINLQMDLAPDLKPIRGDASALTHAFMNLCVNAVDAMPEHGTIIFRTRNLDGDWVEVVVEDTGTGMPREILEKALDPFFTTKEVGKGTGLGLSMVYSTVKAHRGKMEILSEPGLGTRVVLQFPACCEDSPKFLGSGDTSGTTTPQQVLNVLLVDDDELIQHSVQAVLHSLGHAVLVTSSGEEALAAIEAAYEPDLVIMDMNMPGLAAKGTLPLLRGLRPKVPVILSTGRADQTALTLASTHPAVTLLFKPFGLKELQRHLESLGLG